jgi:hypothetical protein
LAVLGLHSLGRRIFTNRLLIKNRMSMFICKADVLRQTVNCS